MNERFVSARALSTIATGAVVYGLFGGLMLGTIFWLYGLSVLGAVAVAVGIIACARTALVRFEVRPGGLLVCNYLRTSTIDPAEIDRFGWRTRVVGFGPGGQVLLPALAIRLRGGRVIVASATGGMSGEKAQRLLRVVSDFASTHDIAVELEITDLRPDRAADLKSVPL